MGATSLTDKWDLGPLGKRTEKATSIAVAIQRTTPRDDTISRIELTEDQLKPADLDAEERTFGYVSAHQTALQKLAAYLKEEALETTPKWSSALARGIEWIKVACERVALAALQPQPQCDGRRTVAGRGALPDSPKHAGHRSPPPFVGAGPFIVTTPGLQGEAFRKRQRLQVRNGNRARLAINHEQQTRAVVFSAAGATQMAQRLACARECPASCCARGRLGKLANICAGPSLRRWEGPAGSCSGTRRTCARLSNNSTTHHTSTSAPTRTNRKEVSIFTGPEKWARTRTCPGSPPGDRRPGWTLE